MEWNTWGVPLSEMPLTLRALLSGARAGRTGGPSGDIQREREDTHNHFCSHEGFFEPKLSFFGALCWMYCMSGEGRDSVELQLAVTACCALVIATSMLYAG